MKTIKEILTNKEGFNHLVWMHRRLILLGENTGCDYMLKLKQIIDDLDEYIIGYENLMCSAPINTEINIIDAKTAKNNSEDYLKSKHIDEIKIINDKINEAMYSGKSSVTFENASFSQNTLNQLKSLGYKINYGRHYNDEYTEINWK